MNPEHPREAPGDPDEAASPGDGGSSRTNGGNTQKETQTLGVLLVHGIGAQRRGDTLVHCATALHKWLRDWLTKGDSGEDLSIDLMDANVAESGPDHPAQVRIIFRRKNEVFPTSWLLAESCWFGTYRRPGFYEFVRWALRVLPIAIVVHFLPRYRRDWAAFSAGQDAVNKGEKLNGLANNESLGSYRNSMMMRVLGYQARLALAGAVALVIQLLLLAVAILAVIPGITRAFAEWVQLKLSETLGDSYLFVTSPITGAVVATRVKKDLEWLASRCDRVIIVAHSQGAAVSYSVIERESWGGLVPEKLHALITYGSGLRKLFDLGQAERDRAWLWVLLGVYAMIISALMAGVIVLFLVGGIPLWAALLGTALGCLLQIVPMTFLQSWVSDPTILKTSWYDFYSSEDPVPAGPIDFKRQEPPPDATIDSLLHSLDSAFVEIFKSRQREVVNRGSILADHTSYWSSQDDFVAHVAGVLAKASDVPIHLPLDEEWMKVSTERRRWRVTWLSQCRTVAALVAISILFWPRAILEAVGTHVQKWTAMAATVLPEKIEGWVQGPLVPKWVLGVVGLIFGTYLMFLVASAAWRVWEGRELKRFFLRKPYSSVGLAGWIFALGWIGVLTSAQLFASAYTSFGWETLLKMTLAPSALAIWSACVVIKSRHGPGMPQDWGRRVISHAELLLTDKKSERTEALRSARFCFRSIQRDPKQAGTEEWALAVLGETRVIEELAKSDPSVRDEATSVCRLAIEALENSGRDASEVKARLLSIQ